MELVKATETSIGSVVLHDGVFYLLGKSTACLWHLDPEEFLRATEAIAIAMADPETGELVCTTKDGEHFETCLKWQDKIVKKLSKLKNQSDVSFLALFVGKHCSKSQARLIAKNALHHLHGLPKSYDLNLENSILVRFCSSASSGKTLDAVLQFNADASLRRFDTLFKTAVLQFNADARKQQSYSQP